MFFGDKLKKEREKKGWSQEYLATKIHVSRQSVSKWETGKNYPNIGVIIDLSDLFGITIDELLRSDRELKEKIIQDSKGSTDLNWKSYLLTSLGILMGIMIVSIIKHDGINWISISWSAVATAALLYLISLLFPQGSKKSETKK
ncbi:transcriptional regulator [Bacillus thuringiensis]|uniref:helix-turn-helix domain-containing protein n=1 Tax=Bacillus thuringiensis TaxID=1428 RepID=UPI000BEC793D|nr:helix-turn-helix transcriptional regulator [Bacillus thuringiensis]MCU4836841.1 helix-turn-helix domain-containing protein [Bacillus cereus]PEC71167.1 transcriptional regulator [Bacillus thuringiensis]PFC01844.1 transcriptional regulator [Bacillus thuringiensis]PFC54220.1 transcriptional regulator [Bacillus thuringiensis]PFD87952.1 transcriptional regulator [Bacillus thuringiensis]